MINIKGDISIKKVTVNSLPPDLKILSEYRKPPTPLNTKLIATLYGCSSATALKKLKTLLKLNLVESYGAGRAVKYYW